MPWTIFYSWRSADAHDLYALFSIVGTPMNLASLQFKDISQSMGRGPTFWKPVLRPNTLQLSVHAKRNIFLLRHFHEFYRRERHRLLCYVAIWHLPLMIDIWGGDLGRSTAWSGPFRRCTPGWVVYVKYLGWDKGFKNGLLDHRRDCDRLISIEDERFFVGRGLGLEFDLDVSWKMERQFGIANWRDWGIPTTRTNPQT